MNAVPILLAAPRRCPHCGGRMLFADPDDVPPAGIPRSTRGVYVRCAACAREAYIIRHAAAHRPRRRPAQPNLP